MKQLGVGLMGTGWVSGEYIKAFQNNPNCRVIAICSRDRARAAAKAAEHHLKDCMATSDLREMLGEKAIDVVAICTPHDQHVEQGVACARNGKHVLVEKPVALNLEGLRCLDAAIRTAGVKSISSFVLRWHPMVANVRAMLDQKLVGNVFYAEVDYMHGIGPCYASWKWLTSKQTGGSSLLMAGCHAVDTLRYIMGDEAVEVTAYSNTSKSNSFQYEYDPNVVTIIRFAGGAMGKVASLVECRMPYVFNVQLFGDKGTIRNNQLFTTDWPGQNGWATIPTVLPDSGDVSHHPFQVEIDHFVECILTNTESHASIGGTFKTHEICLAADLSAAEGRPVRLPLE
ncbi:MAG TPA: Gfo/Idh/MocA family oxidoreductase [Bryobacteraceae bacterium]|nr:Gfo/Idh/MocA family oxidoreductase [Bryobacteraceae bacterium]